MPTSTCDLTGEVVSFSVKAASFAAKFDAPLPRLSVSEIWRSMMLHRNEKFLFRRECSLSGKTFISAYDNQVVFPVYTNELWWGDSWDACDYGRNYDFSRPFFEQFKELQNVVPREGTSVFSSENCEYNSHTRECKNSYLNTLAVKSENAYYCYWAVGNHNTVDCLITNGSTLCYETIDCENCYESVYLKDCHHCSNSAFSYDLRNCNYCIGCSNLRYKEFHILNKPVSKEDFFKVQKQLLDGSYSGYLKGLDIFEKIYSRALHRSTQQTNCLNSTGDHLLNCKNCEGCFDSDASEDCRYSIALNAGKDIQFASSAGWPGCELVYYSTVSRGCSNIRFCYYSWFSQNLSYCDGSVSSNDCFGSIGVRHKKNCILNKSYTQHEYEILQSKIISQMKETGEWGQYFPSTLSTFAYDDTQAQEYFPLEKNAAIARGYRWRDPEVSELVADEEFQLPDGLGSTDDAICSKVLLCQETKRPYQIQKGELEIYRKLSVPIPRKHPDVRHQKRMAWRNERRLKKSSCAECGDKILSTFASPSELKVLCERCYSSKL